MLASTICSPFVATVEGVAVVAFAALLLGALGGLAAGLAVGRSQRPRTEPFASSDDWGRS